LLTVKEGGRYRERAFRTLHGEELAIAEQLLHSPQGDAELIGYAGEG
jgi:hypothetical protein